MNNSLPENKSRRKAVKTIVGGLTALVTYNVLPVKWNKPVVESIFLPAHAATSGTSLHDPCSLSLISGSRNTNTVVIQVNGYVVPATANLPTTVVAMPVGTGNTVTETTKTLSDGTFTVTLTITGGPSISRINVTTTVMGAAGSATCALDLSGDSGNTGQPEDSDGDGVPNTSDVCNGYDDNVDSDADSVPDGCDVCEGHDDTSDDDGDGIPDGCDNICISAYYIIGDAHLQQLDITGMFDETILVSTPDISHTIWAGTTIWAGHCVINIRASSIFTNGEEIIVVLTHPASGQSETITVYAKV